MDTPTLCLSYPSSPPEGVVPSTPVLKRGPVVNAAGSLVPSGFNTPASSSNASSSGVATRTRTRQFSVPRTPASTSSGRDARSDELRQLDVVRNIWNWVGGAGGATPVRTSPSDALVPVVMPKPTTTRQQMQIPRQTDRLSTTRMRTRLSSGVGVGGEASSKGQGPNRHQSLALMTVKRTLTVKADAKRAGNVVGKAAAAAERKAGVLAGGGVGCEKKGGHVPTPTRVKRYLTRRSAAAAGSGSGSSGVAKTAINAAAARRSLVRGGGGKEPQPVVHCRMLTNRGAGDAVVNDEAFA